MSHKPHNGKPRKRLSAADVKKLLTDNANGYMPSPIKPLKTRVAERVIEMYQVNKFTPDEIIENLGILCGTALKASGQSSVEIKGQNNILTITITEVEKEKQDVDIDQASR